MKNGSRERGFRRCPPQSFRCWLDGAAGMPYHLDRALLRRGGAGPASRVNFANDYSDGIRGTDKNRTGPMRLVASVSQRGGRAARSGHRVCNRSGGRIALSLQVDAWLIAVGFSAIAAAWFYTGGRSRTATRPRGSVRLHLLRSRRTLGRRTCSTFVHRRLALASLAVGSLTTALLVVNNLRDIPATKRPESVRWLLRWRRATRRLYLALLAAAALATLAVVVLHPWALVAFIAAAAAIRRCKSFAAARPAAPRSRAGRYRPARTGLRRALCS